MPPDVGPRLRRLLRVIVQDGREITRDSHLVCDLGLDELTIVELTLACEGEFGVALVDREVEQAETVGALEDMLDRIC